MPLELTSHNGASHMPTIDFSELPASIKAAILAAVGTCATVIVLLVTNVPSTGGDDAGTDAGIDAGPEPTDTCTSKRYTCTAYTSPPSRFKPDAGNPPYVPLIVLGQRCTASDGGTYKVLPPLTNETIVDQNFCVENNPQAGDEEALPQAEPIGTDNHGCACKRERFCNSILADGGTPTAPWGVTLPYQGFSGADCFPKVCVEIAGISSWPSECPTSRPLDAGFEDE